MMFDCAKTEAHDGIGSIRQPTGLNGNGAGEHAHEFEAATATQGVASLPQRQSPTEKVADSRGPAEQLEAELETTGRRLQQLIGERNRLTTLLGQRDAQLQRLNRELGALTERVKPAARRQQVLLQTARAIFEKIRPGLPPRGTRSSSAQPETPRPASSAEALVPWVQNGPPKAVLGVVVFGLSAAEIEKVLAAIGAYCEERELAPLLLTDNDVFQLFRGRRVLFEFLPAHSEQQRCAPELDWRLYTLRRLALIKRKWQPIRVVAFGRRAAEVVKLWHDSPFEVTPIPAALNGSPANAEFPRTPAQLGAW